MLGFETLNARVGHPKQFRIRVRFGNASLAPLKRAFARASNMYCHVFDFIDVITHRGRFETVVEVDCIRVDHFSGSLSCRVVFKKYIK